MCVKRSSFESLDNDPHWSHAMHVGSRALIVIVALAAIACFALCFINHPQLPTNYFNHNVAIAYGAIAFCTLSLLVFLVKREQEDEKPTYNLSSRRNSGDAPDPHDLYTPKNRGSIASDGTLLRDD